MARTRSAPTVDRLDAEMASAALKKRQAGIAPTRDEQAALRRVGKIKEEEQRWAFYGSIPKKHWIELTGRPAKVINEGSDNHDLPTSGPTIDLGSFLRRVYDILAANRHTLSGATGDGILPEGTSQQLKDRYVEQQIAEKEERVKLLRIERLEKENTLILVDQVREVFAIAAKHIRESGVTIRRQFGADASRLLEDGLAEASHEINTRFGGGPEDDEETADQEADQKPGREKRPGRKTAKKPKRKKKPDRKKPAQKKSGRRAGPHRR